MAVQEWKLFALIKSVLSYKSIKQNLLIWFAEELSLELEIGNLFSNL